MPVSLPLERPVAALTALYGEVPRPRAGVVHVAAVWRAQSGDDVTLRIGPDTPPSAIDWFALSAARARADAIVTTGRILRAEPTLAHDLRGPTGAALSDWRTSVLGRHRTPLLLVLTRGTDLPIAHPALHTRARPIIYTATEAAARLRTQVGAGIVVAGEDRPSLHSAVHYLQAQHACQTILIEAGPSTSAALYADPTLVDELLLSVYESRQLPVGARGPKFVSRRAIARTLPHRSPGYRDGDWLFLRFTR